MIYIDPPYNTGNDGFIYQDNFKDSEQELCEKFHLQEEDIDLLTDVYKTTAHSSWLSFIYPRLLLAQDLLTEDGCIFISIDDNEQANLKIICDEIFGESNFVASMPRKTRGSATTKSYAELQSLHDYILVYWKNKNSSSFKLKNNGIKEYPYEDIRGKFYIIPLQDNGPHGTRSARPNLYYPIYQQSNGILSLHKTHNDDIELLPKKHKNEDGRWMWSPKKFITDSNDLYVKDSKIFIKHYYNEKEDQIKYQVERTWLDNFQNTKGTIDLTNIFEKAGLFSHPKPVDLVAFLIQLSTESTNTDIILDFFAGSGTTGQAVMELNQEEFNKQTKDGLLADAKPVGGRRFILVQLPEKIDEKKEAFKAGYKKISDITIERVKRAGEKYQNVDNGFKVLGLVDNPDKENLFNLKNVDDNLFIITHLALFYGYGLNYKIKKIAEKEIYLMKSEIEKTKDAIIILEKNLLTMQDIMLLVKNYGKEKYKFFSCDSALNIELTYNLLQHFQEKNVVVF
jgi:adenine-specific DNA-methyltransferase